MKRIHKYPIPMTDEFTLELPKGAEILTFQTQKDKPYIWVIIDQTKRQETVGFKLFGTGHSIESISDLEYIGTAQTVGGLLLWHLFKCKPLRHKQEALKLILKGFAEEAMWQFYKRTEGVPVNRVISEALNKEIALTIDKILRVIK